MAISYLSKPSQIEVTPYQEPIEFILQAANIKQNRYDKILDTTFQKENELLSIDTQWASKEVTDHKNQMLGKMEKDLDANIGSDLLNPNNIDKMESIFKPITQDQDIIDGVQITNHVKKEGAYFADWRKKHPELYSAKNEAFFWDRAKQNTQLSSVQAKKEGYKMPIATEYTDIDKLFRESIKDLHPDIVQTMVRGINGQPDGYIYTKKGKVLSQNDILDALPMDSKIMAQAEINAYYDYQGVDKNQVLDVQRSAISKAVADNDLAVGKIDQESKYIQDNITDIEKNTKAGMEYVKQTGATKEEVLAKLKDDLQSYSSQKEQYKQIGQQYKENQTTFDASYGFDAATGKFTKPLSEDQLLSLKTNLWLTNKKQGFAKSWSYEETEFEAKPDEYDVLRQTHEYKMDEEKLKAQDDLAKDVYMENLKTANGQYNKKGGGKGSKVDENGNTIEEDDNPFVSTSSSTVQDLDQPGASFDKLQEQLGKSGLGKDQIVRSSVDAINSIGGSITAEQLKQEAVRYRTIAKVVKDKNIPLDTKMPNSNQTYRQYFNDDKTQQVKQFTEAFDKAASNQGNDRAIILQVNEKAKEQAYKYLPGYKFVPKELKVYADGAYLADITGGADDAFILQKASNGLQRLLVGAQSSFTIPADLSEKYINRNLSKEDYMKILDYNHLPLGKGHENDMIKIIKNSTPVDGTLAKVKDEFAKARDQFSKDYGKGYLGNDLYIGNSVDKGAGKDVDLAAKKYVQINIASDEKLRGKDIDVLQFTRKSDSPSGWGVVYKAYTSQIVDGKEKKDGVTAPKTINLDNQFVLKYGLNRQGDVSSIEQSLNQQFNGNLKTGGKYKGQLPFSMYYHGGNVYKFIMKEDGDIMLQKQVGGNFERVKGLDGEDVSTVNLGLQLIQQENNINAR